METALKCERPKAFGEAHAAAQIRLVSATYGDTTADGLPEVQVAARRSLCERVVSPAEKAAFEYLLILVDTPGSQAPSWRRIFPRLPV